MRREGEREWEKEEGRTRRKRMGEKKRRKLKKIKKK